MKKLFISQPMKGLTSEEIAADRARILAFAENALRANFKDYEILDTYFSGSDDWTSIDYLAESIKYLGKADMAVFGKGWSKNRGCKIEHLVCEEYDIPYLQEDISESVAEEDDFSGADGAPEFWTEF